MMTQPQPTDSLCSGAREISRLGLSQHFQNDLASPSVKGSRRSLKFKIAYATEYSRTNGNEILQQGPSFFREKSHFIKFPFSKNLYRKSSRPQSSKVPFLKTMCPSKTFQSPILSNSHWFANTLFIDGNAQFLDTRKFVELHSLATENQIHRRITQYGVRLPSSRQF